MGLKRAGGLKERIAFDAPLWGDDGSGGSVRTWEYRYSCLAEFIYTGGGESSDAGSLASKATFKIRIRKGLAAQEIQANWRMRDLRRGPQDDEFPGVEYNIRQVDAITDRRWVYLVVESGVSS